MKVEYSKRATTDLHKVSADSRAFGEMVAAAVGVAAGVHVAALVRYPYKILYRTLDDGVRILHIRHTSRQVWEQV